MANITREQRDSISKHVHDLRKTPHPHNRLYYHEGEIRDQEGEYLHYYAVDLPGYQVIQSQK